MAVDGAGANHRQTAAFQEARGNCCALGQKFLHQVRGAYHTPSMGQEDIDVMQKSIGDFDAGLRRTIGVQGRVACSIARKPNARACTRNGQHRTMQRRSASWALMHRKGRGVRRDDAETVS